MGLCKTGLKIGALAPSTMALSVVQPLVFSFLFPYDRSSSCKRERPIARVVVTHPEKKEEGQEYKTEAPVDKLGI